MLLSTTWSASTRRALTAPQPFRVGSQAVVTLGAVRALDQTGGNQARAAELVGLPLRTFVKRLTHHGLTKARKADP